MKKYLLSVLFFIFCYQSFSQNLRWLTNIGSFGDDGFWQRQITIDNNDNVVLVADFGDSILLGANYVKGYQLIKFDSSGQFLWNTPVPNGFFGICESSITTDNLNNIYIACLHIRKYNAAGILLDTTAIPPSNNTINPCPLGTTNLGVDVFGNVYLTGNYDDLMASPQPALMKGCDEATYLMKFDSTLNLGWKIENDTSYRFASQNLLPGINGDMFAGSAGFLGKFDSTGLILGTSVITSSLFSQGSSFLRYNSIGNIVSNYAMNSISIFDTSANLISNTAIPFATAYPNSFEIVDDTTYVFGSCFSGTVILSNPFQQFYTSHGVGWSNDFLLAFYDTACNLSSAIQLGNAANEQIQLKKFSNGDLLIAGNYGKAADGTTTYFDLGNNHLQSTGGYDFFLARTSPHYSYLTPANNYASKEIELFPNPPSTVLNFANSNDEKKITCVEIFDMAGKSILIKKENNLKEISIKNLPQGIYIAKISTEKNIFYKKFLKE